MKLSVLFLSLMTLSSLVFAGPISSGGDEKAREFDCVAFENVDELYAIRIRDVAGTITQVSLWTAGPNGELQPAAAVYAMTSVNQQVDAVQIDHVDQSGEFTMSVLPMHMMGIFSGSFPGTNFSKDAVRMHCEEIR